MEKKILPNGLTILYEERNSDTVVIHLLVKSGSEHENKNNLGVAHFVEHRVFETKTRTQQEITSEIENIGGEMNANTGKELTNFYIHIPKKHFDKSLEIISDMMKNAHFDEKEIEKEKKIILEEVKLWKDDPKWHQWELFEKVLFKGHPAGEPTIGTIETITNMKSKDLLNFYEKHYNPKNMIITIIGKIDNVFEKIENVFGDLKRKPIEKKGLKITPKNNPRSLIEKKDVDHSYMVLGYKIPLRDSKESYVFDVISNILGYGLSGRLFNEIRTKRGLAYNVGINLNINKDTGFFAAFVSTDKKNIEECKKIILNEFNKLKNLSKDDLEKAKISIEGNLILKKENPIELALYYSFWEYIKDANMFDKYINNMRKVSLEVIKKVVEKYLDKNYTLVVIEQQ